MTEITIRSAAPTDADASAFADFVALAAAEAFPIFFGSSGHTLMRQVFPRPGHAYSYDKAYFIEVKGRTAGMMSGLTWQQSQAERGQTSWLLIRVMKWQCWRYFWGMLQLRLLNLRAGQCREGEYYVQFVAVYPRFRRRKLGRRLMTMAEEVARVAGCQKLALDVAVTNRGAIGLYQKAGYTIAKILPPKPRNVRVGQVYQMMKEL